MNTPERTADAPSDVPGFGTAVAAESLYLANLMVAPGLAFAALLVLWFKHRHSAPPLARCHLRQTIAGTLWGGALLVLVNAAIILMGGYDAPHTWVLVILYFTTCHSTLILFGAIGFAKAMSAKPYVYPLIGPRNDD
ncbi:hypothetical protein G3580_16785 [Nitrogeniibacter mangrovi]|uniref:Cytochrome C oxidase subunit III n=1 Tax=Nitrogeniibacter mangrovi TaxID=2016596 RepID=A0A6C1B8R6_9RHOO|nr:hypothetical protein [Nitrogeniibacter mangrovi]QID19128.1 hypothetical protein G3580_16785 [Nitrogeniibacter mangrovi]